MWLFSEISVWPWRSVLGMSHPLSCACLVYQMARPCWHQQSPSKGAEKISGSVLCSAISQFVWIEGEMICSLSQREQNFFIESHKPRPHQYPADLWRTGWKALLSGQINVTEVQTAKKFYDVAQSQVILVGTRVDWEFPITCSFHI